MGRLQSRCPDEPPHLALKAVDLGTKVENLLLKLGDATILPIVFLTCPR